MGEENPIVDATPVGAGSSTSTSPDSTDATATPGDAVNDAGGDASIPKARFDQVIAERNALRESLEEQAQELAEQTVEELLKDKPELRDMYFGKGGDTAPKADPKPATPENPTDRQMRELMDWKQREEQRAELTQIADAVESNMDQFEVLKDAQARKIAIAEISSALAQNPKASIPKVVKAVADELTEFISNTEKKVFERKKSGGAFPANGPGGTAPIVEPEKLSFTDGSTKRALAQIFAQEG